MKTSDVHIGTCYTCKVNHKLVIVEILSANPKGGWNAKNLSTGKTTHIKTAQRLRGFAKGANTSPRVARKTSLSNQPGTKTKSTHTPQSAPTKRPTILDAAVKVLAKSDNPMNCRQIIEIAIKKNYWQPKKSGKTPQNTLNAAISREIKTKGYDSRFEKAGRGRFMLAQ